MIAMHCHKQKPQSGSITGAILAIAFSVALAPAARAAQPYTAEAMWQLKRLADPAISPDGRLAVVPVTKYDVDKNKGDADLWLVPTKPGKARQLTSDAGSDSAPAWSPDGELIAFVSKRGDDKQPQLYVIPVAAGEEGADDGAEEVTEKQSQHEREQDRAHEVHGVEDGQNEETGEGDGTDVEFPLKQISQPKPRRRNLLLFLVLLRDSPRDFRVHH